MYFAGRPADAARFAREVFHRHGRHGLLLPKRGGADGIDRTAFHDLHMSRTTEGECARTFFWKKKNFFVVCSRFLGIPAWKNAF